MGNGLSRTISTLNVELEYHLRQHGKVAMLDMVQEISKINIHYIRQKHIRGVGDAILCAESFIDNEPFTVLLGDDIIYYEEEPAIRRTCDASADANV